MASLCLDSLVSGGLIANYQCSSACAHCVYRSSPDRERGYITRERAAANYRAVRRLGCRAMHIGGGEPFLHIAGLLDALRAARDERLVIDYVETNASWFRDEEHAVTILGQLRSLGCDALLVSIDPFHNAAVPFRKVKGLMAACHSAGTSVFPWRMEFFEEINRFDDTRTHGIEEYEVAYGPGYLASLEHRYGMNLGGRALTTFAPYHPQQPLTRVLEEGTRACRVLANGCHFHTDLHGDFVPTHCPGLAVAVEDLGQPLDPGRYPAVTRLYELGPTGLCEAARDHGFVPRQTYAVPCELCDDVRTFLALHLPEHFPDLRPLEFYRVDRALRPRAEAGANATCGTRCKG